MDGAAADKRFSLIADDIHSARNVLAHQGYSSLQHRVEYFDDQISEGWKAIENTTHINPAVYAQQFEQAITDHKFVAEYAQESAERRIVRKYRFILRWLRVDRSSEISQEVKKFDALPNMPDLQAQEAVVQDKILGTYGIT